MNQAYHLARSRIPLPSIAEVFLIIVIFLTSCSAPTIPLVVTTAAPTMQLSPTVTPKTPAPPTITPIPAVQPTSSLTPSPDVLLSPALVTRVGQGAIERLAVSKHGKQAAIASNNQICSFSTQDFRTAWCAWVDTAPFSSIWSLVFNPDGKMIAAGLWNGKIAILDAFEGRRVQLILTGDDNIRSLAWSPDGARLVFGQTQNGSRNAANLVITDVHTGKEVTVITMESGVASLSWSQGEIVALATGGYAEVWDLSNNHRLLKVTNHHSWGVECVAISSDRQWLAPPRLRL